MGDHDHAVLTAALEAWDAGLCPIPANIDGTKSPRGRWMQWQTRRPSREQLIKWFQDGHPGVGVVCGAVSNNLEMFELEARFVRKHGTKAFARAMKAAGLEALLDRLIAGMVVISPSDGRHLMYFVDGPAHGNTKLARDLDENDEVCTLIETRGEGGFVILPPSHGPTHKTGKDWRIHAGSFATIPTITTDERDALFEVARSFDESPAPVPPAPLPAAARVQVQRWAAGTVGESWFDAVEDHLAAEWSMQGLLEHYGWVYCYTDRHGRALLRRPGKDEGVSGSVNESGRFHPFSTSVPFEVGGRPARTFDLLDVVAAYEHGGDRKAAARELALRTGVLEAWKASRPSPPPMPVPDDVDPVTGEILSPRLVAVSIDLDEEFWTSRAFLAHIRQAARSRLVSPWAVLGAVLARAAGFTPPSTCLPAIVGTTAPLSTFIALHGNSGAGKSTPEGVARDLLPDVPSGCVGPLALGSGEGLVEAFMDTFDEVGDDGKKRKVKRQVRHGAVFSLDEGQLLAEITQRRGSTILPVLRTAWSGGDPGMANASVETRRSLRPGSYAVGLVSLWQDKAAAMLLADVDGGTPQRFVWLPADDAGASVDTPEWPGPLEWHRPELIILGDVVRPNPLEVDPAIVLEVRTHRVGVLTHAIEPPSIDAHRPLNKLKLAGLLTVLDNRRRIELDDWRLAELIMSMSDSVRARVMFEAARRAEEVFVLQGRRAVARDEMVEASATVRALQSAARSVWHVASKNPTVPTMRPALHAGIAGRVRQLVSTPDAIAEAERLGWVVETGPGWLPGPSHP
jgi:hypothetical protein